jgi:hypothetical protein
MEQIKEDSPIGDLANDAKRDKGWKGNDVESLRSRMYANMACSDAHKALDEAECLYSLSSISK